MKNTGNLIFRNNGIIFCDVFFLTNKLERMIYVRTYIGVFVCHKHHGIIAKILIFILKKIKGEHCDVFNGIEGQ